MLLRLGREGEERIDRVLRRAEPRPRVGLRVGHLGPDPVPADDALEAIDDVPRDGVLWGAFDGLVLDPAEVGDGSGGGTGSLPVGGVAEAGLAEAAEPACGVEDLPVLPSDHADDPEAGGAGGPS